MARAYLIGGTPRCGKTSIALEAIKLHPMFAASTDSIRHVLRQIFTPDTHPEIFESKNRFTEEAILRLCSSGNAAEIIDWQNKESEIVWESVKQCIEGFIAEDLDILVEGVATLPEFLSQLSCDFSAIFVGNTSPEHSQHMLEFARSGSYDWMSKFEDRTIIQFGRFTNEFSGFIKTEASKHNFKYFEMGTSDYEHAKHLATRLLLQQG